MKNKLTGLYTMGYCVDVGMRECLDEGMMERRNDGILSAKSARKIRKEEREINGCWRLVSVI